MERYHHRRVILEQGDDATGGRRSTRHGYVLSTHLVLAHAREPDRRVDTSMVQEVEFERLVPVRTATTIAEPWGDDEIAAQLNDAKRLIMRAVSTRFFAAIVDDRVVAYCEVRSDGRTAQIEDVEAVRAYRGRGLGRAIVQHALDEARRDHDVVFLEALADDWPRRLYAKLGFDAVDRRDFLTKFPHPLTRLRLRTPRLELRLPTVFELRQLFRVAERGIHDPEFMPFERRLDRRPERARLPRLPPRTSSPRSAPESWSLAPRGLPRRRADRRAGDPRRSGSRATGRWTTGSWLGGAWQGQGLGTEMRAAVLTLAFDELGAERRHARGRSRGTRSRSASRASSATSTSASHTVSPRGIPVEHATTSSSRVSASARRCRSRLIGLEGLLAALRRLVGSRLIAWRRRRACHDDAAAPPAARGSPRDDGRAARARGVDPAATTSRRSRARPRTCGARTGWCSSATSR